MKHLLLAVAGLCLAAPVFAQTAGPAPTQALTRNRRGGYGVVFGILQPLRRRRAGGHGHR